MRLIKKLQEKEVKRLELKKKVLEAETDRRLAEAKYKELIRNQLRRDINDDDIGSTTTEEWNCEEDGKESNGFDPSMPSLVSSFEESPDENVVDLTEEGVSNGDDLIEEEVLSLEEFTTD